LALYFLETSALVKLYIQETGTEKLLNLASPAAGNRLAILSLAQVEFRSAIRRRERNGEIPGFAAEELLESFRRHAEGRFLTQPLGDFLLDTAAVLIDRQGLRAYDALQLAGYLALCTTATPEQPIFVCADKDLLAAAQSENLPVLDPCLP